MSEKLKSRYPGRYWNGRTKILFSLLENHPWFEVTTIAASPRSAGKHMQRQSATDGK